MLWFYDPNGLFWLWDCSKADDVFTAPRGHQVPQLQLAFHLRVRHATFPSFTNCRASSYAATGLERWNGICSKGRESKSCRGNKRHGKKKMSSLNICKYTVHTSKVGHLQKIFSKVCQWQLFHGKIYTTKSSYIDNSIFLAVMACFL